MRSLQCVVVCMTIVGAVQLAYGADKAAARAAYADGSRYYDLNQFDRALEAFQRAYWNYEDPAFLFNIAQCHRQLSHRRDAIAFYKSYLRKVDNAPNRDEVRRIIGELEASPESEDGVRSRQSAQPQPQPVTPTVSLSPSSSATVAVAAPPPAKPIYKRWWLWTGLGVVVAGAATGLAVGLTSGRTEPTLTTGHVQ